MCVLVLEASTSSAKAMLYDAEYGVLRVESKPYGDEIGGADSHRMQPLFEKLMRVGRKVAGDDPIECIALVGSWHTLVVTDPDLCPLFPSLTWASDVGSSIATEIRKDPMEADRLYLATGCMPNTTYSLYKFLQLKKEGKLPASFLVMDENAYLFYRLTGEWATSRPAMAGTSFLNIHTLNWDASVLERMGVRKEQFPRLCHHLDTYPLSEEAAEALGVPAGIPVVMPEPDGAMNQVGAGAMKQGVMTLSIGTSAAMRRIYGEPFLSHEHVNWCYYAPGAYIAGCATAGSTNCVDWFRKNIAQGMSFAELEQGICINANSPHFLPFLFGERCPGWDDGRTAAFHGIHSRHTVHDLYAAVLEGILHNVYDCYSTLIKESGEPEKILLSGGILKSAWWTQLLADLFQREIIVSDVEQVSLLGGAAMALCAVGKLRSLSDFSPHVEERVILPRTETAELMKQRFLQYKELYLAK